MLAVATVLAVAALKNEVMEKFERRDESCGRRALDGVRMSRVNLFCIPFTSRSLKPSWFDPLAHPAELFFAELVLQRMP
jgi:hypothetical protein